MAINKGYIKENPYDKFKVRRIKTNTRYVKRDKLSEIESLKYTKPGIELTRMAFLFSCYTGLRYQDVFSVLNGIPSPVTNHLKDNSGNLLAII